MSYRPRSRSRSPEYRRRGYSPSRPFSRSPPPPPRRYENPPPRFDDYGPSVPRYDTYGPPPSRFDDRAAPIRRSLPPPPRMGDRYEEEYPPRPRERYEDDRYPSRGIREDSGERYGERARTVGMAADREEVRAKEMPKRESSKPVEPAWERGRDVEELAVCEAASLELQTILTYAPQITSYVIPQAEQGGRRAGAGAKGPSEPSRDVIFLGLDAELTDSDVSAYPIKYIWHVDDQVVHGLLASRASCTGRFCQNCTRQAQWRFKVFWFRAIHVCRERRRVHRH